MDIVYEACKILKLVLQARAPYETGNLAMNSIRIAGNRVIIGGEIAPYAPITNEPWTAAKWNGARNPNQGWVQAAIKEAAPIIQRVLSGRATDEDVQRATNRYNGILAERKKERLVKLKEKRQKQTGVVSE
ncbi:MAG: hypothetical protein IJ308_04405 [Clostridia bacterium]|nr:hypothetical protein [Clostridia bacterium]